MSTPATEEITITTTRLIAPGPQLGYSRLYLDFVAGRARELFPASTIDDLVDRVAGPGRDRRAVLEILRRQNRDFGASAATLENVERLADPRSVCVFAGQQAGLFGGPLFTIIKALAVARTARLYSERLRRPVIPIFWIAGDDHDFEEANHTYLVDRRGELRRLAYRTAPPSGTTAAGTVLADAAELERVKAEFRECLGESEFTPALYDLVERAYTPGATLVTAFGRLMAQLTGDLGLVLFNPGDAELKRTAAPFFRAAVEKQSSIRDSLASANQRLQDAGYHLQVEKKENAAHLFYHRDGRTPIMRERQRFVAGERSFTEPEMLREIDSHPDLFSPDALLRPLFQAYLFPVAVQMAGPSELAYMAQMNPLFALFELTAPLHRARPSLTLIEPRLGQQMDQMGIRFEDLTGDVEQVVNRVMTASFPSHLESNFQTLREALARQFEEFRARVLGFDPGLKESAEQTRGKIDFAVKGFESKVFAAHKKKSQQTRDRIYRLYNTLFPNRGLQERSLNVSYFLARYGIGSVKYLYERMEPEQTAHQLITMSDYEA